MWTMGIAFVISALLELLIGVKFFPVISTLISSALGTVATPTGWNAVAWYILPFGFMFGIIYIPVWLLIKRIKGINDKNNQF